MAGVSISYHEAVRRIDERIKKDGTTTIGDRFESPGLVSNSDQRCPFCRRVVRFDTPDRAGVQLI